MSKKKLIRIDFFDGNSYDHRPETFYVSKEMAEHIRTCITDGKGRVMIIEKYIYGHDEHDYMKEGWRCTDVEEYINLRNCLRINFTAAEMEILK